MKGIILYADDDVLNHFANENKLFNKFNSSSAHSIIPITNLEDLEKTIFSISTFRALLLDWNFKKPKINEEMPEINENPFEFLKANKIYSLVYIYSRDALPPDTQTELKTLYGEDKIFFEQKSAEFNEDDEFSKICKGISAFEERNKHMEIPFAWSQSINKAAQTIFSELEQASPNWIKEIMDTAKGDGADDCSEVINIFQNILDESLIQDKQLRDVLSNYAPSDIAISEENTAKLYRRLFYTKLTENAPIMTGDIFKFNENEYGILITPECEISNVAKKSYEFLIIEKTNSSDFQKKKKGIFTKNANSAKEIFNNGVASRHILVSFPFDSKVFNSIAEIDFCSALKTMENADILTQRSEFKLNSPYIQQLRQRYVAFIGRYGVPVIPESLRNYNLR